MAMDQPLVLDQVQDINLAELAVLSLVHPLPDFVKRASSKQLFQDDLPGTAYAAPSSKLYPCQNAPSTFLSALYFTEKQAAFEPKQREVIATNLVKFARYWGIEHEVAPLLNPPKQAAAEPDDDDYGLVWQSDDGSKDRAMPLRSAVEVKTAASYLLEHRDALPLRDRHTVAVKILEKAAAYGAAIDPAADAFLERTAGRGVCSVDDVVDAVYQRAVLAKTAEQKAQLQSLATSIAEMPAAALIPNMRIKLAEILEDVDKQIGIKTYGEVLQRPEDVLFSTLYKDAAMSVAESVRLTTGKCYEKSAFKKVSLRDVQELFGSDFAGEVRDGLDVDTEKLASLASTLPRPDAELFEHMMSEAGIPPLYQKAASDRFIDRVPDLDALAAQYCSPG